MRTFGCALLLLALLLIASGLTLSATASDGTPVAQAYHLVRLSQLDPGQYRSVIVGFPPNRYPGGHLLVVTGGTSTSVFLVDSSVWNWHSLSRVRFLWYWEGFAAVVTPAASQQQGGQA